MRSLLATVAVGALVGTAAMAQDDAAGSSIYSVSEGDHYASNLLGSRLYTTESELGEQVEYSTVSESWNDVGEINDFVVSEDGSVRAVIVGVGGFLGIGEKDVAISWDDVSATYDDNGSRFLVVPMTQEALETAPAFTYEPIDAATGEAMPTAEGDAAATEEQPAEMAEGDAATEGQPEAEMAETDVSEASEEATDLAQAEIVDEDQQSTETALADSEVSADVAGVADAEGGAAMVENDATMPEGYELVAVDQVSADELEGATVRSAGDDEWVGEISTLILDDAGKITEAVIDVGGFLGMGEKPVAMNFEDLEIMRQGEGGALEVKVTATREELESMDSYQ